MLLNGLFKISFLGRKLAPESDLHQWLTKDGMTLLTGRFSLGRHNLWQQLSQQFGIEQACLCFQFETQVYTPFAINLCAAVVLCHCLRSNVLANTARVFHHVTFMDFFGFFWWEKACFNCAQHASATLSSLGPFLTSIGTILWFSG